MGVYRRKSRIAWGLRKLPATPGLAKSDFIADFLPRCKRLIANFLTLLLELGVWPCPV